MKDITIAVTASAGIFVAWVKCVAAWITAIVVTVQTNAIAMLIVDILIPTVAEIHGFPIWAS